MLIHVHVHVYNIVLSVCPHQDTLYMYMYTYMSIYICWLHVDVWARIEVGTCIYTMYVHVFARLNILVFAWYLCAQSE